MAKSPGRCARGRGAAGMHSLQGWGRLRSGPAGLRGGAGHSHSLPCRPHLRSQRPKPSSLLLQVACTEIATNCSSTLLSRSCICFSSQKAAIHFYAQMQWCALARTEETQGLKHPAEGNSSHFATSSHTCLLLMGGLFKVCRCRS